jgi:hypothetical protein
VEQRQKVFSYVNRAKLKEDHRQEEILMRKHINEKRKEEKHG